MQKLVSIVQGKVYDLNGFLGRPNSSTSGRRFRLHGLGVRTFALQRVELCLKMGYVSTLFHMLFVLCTQRAVCAVKRVDNVKFIFVRV
jgi:hypothetical protein